MKKAKSLLSKIVIFTALVLILAFGRGITAKAVTVNYDKVAVINLINKKTTSSYYGLLVRTDEKDIHVTNIRTSSKNLKAHLYHYSKWNLGNNNVEIIQLIGTKKSSYRLTFDVVDASGNYISTEQAKIIVEKLKDSFKGFKSIKVGKTNILSKCLKDDYTSGIVDLKKSGQLKIKMKKGYTINDIRVERYVPTDEPKLKTDYIVRYADYVIEHIANGDMLNLSTVSDFHNAYTYDDTQYATYYDHIFTYTYLTITYTDKYGNTRSQEITIRSKVE